MEATLEFRGIPARQLIAYLQELGGQQVHASSPILGDGWEAEVLREEEVQITSRFRVNAVFIRFRAETEEKLAQLLAALRKKTMRVGG
jgi:hypothetical protein